MRGIPWYIETEVLNAAIISGKSLISRSSLEIFIESNPDKFPSIIKISSLQRRKWISTAMNRKFSRTIGNAWVIQEESYAGTV